MGNPWGLSGTYTAAQAQAAIAKARANPVLGQRGGRGPRTSIYITGGMPRAVFIPGTRVPGSAGAALGDVSIADQEQAPDNPGVRTVAASSWGSAIPISVGRRRVGGNIIYATPLIPRRVGDVDYYVKVPLDVVPGGCCDDDNDGNTCQPPNPDDACDNRNSGFCTEVRQTAKRCINYETGKWVVMECTPVGSGIGHGWSCHVVNSNVPLAQEGQFAFQVSREDGGVAQCDYCERIGVYSASEECIEGIEARPCTPIVEPS